MSETVSIIMAVYNGEAWLCEQIQSVIGNSFTDWKLYIYDDCSSDRTAAIVNEFAAAHPDRIFFRVNEFNQGAALNFLNGAAAADGKYIMFCDQDDVWLPNKIIHALEKIREMEKQWGQELPLALFSDARVVDEALEELEPSFHKSGRLNPCKLDLAHILMENKLLGCTMLFNRPLKNMLTTIPDRARMHDWWIAIAAAAFGKIGYLETADILYRQHGGNAIGNQSFGKYVKKRISAISEQKETLRRTELQAENFFEIYKARLPEKAGCILYKFAYINSCGWLVRRIRLFRYGYLKSGFIRNLGLFLLI